MLLRLFSVAGAALLSSCAAAIPSNPGNVHHDTHPHIQADSNSLTLPSSHCAFTGPDCKQHISSPTFLTFNFSTENDTLLANDSPIFPISFPMEFPATLYWDGGKQTQDVQLAYSLDARPLPAHQGAVLGSVFLLKLKLFDLHGRPATNSLITIGLSRDSSSENLKISKVDRAPMRGGPGGHKPPHHPQKTWKAELSTYFEGAKTAVKGCFSSKTPTTTTATNARPHGPPHPHPQRPNGSHHRPHHHTPSPEDSATAPYFWASRGDASFVRLVRPVVLPALLGVLAGVVACMTGFVLARVLIAVYTCFRAPCSSSRCARRTGADSLSIPVIRIEDGTLSEKERLMAADAEAEAEVESGCDHSLR